MHNAYLSTVSVCENGRGQEYAQEAFCDHLPHTMEPSNWLFGSSFSWEKPVDCTVIQLQRWLLLSLSSSHDLKKIAKVFLTVHSRHTCLCPPPSQAPRRFSQHRPFHSKLCTQTFHVDIISVCDCVLHKFDLTFSVSLSFAWSWRENQMHWRRV